MRLRGEPTGRLSLEWTATQEGIPFFIEGSGDLIHWILVNGPLDVGPIAGGGYLYRMGVEADSDALFFRLRLGSRTLAVASSVEDSLGLTERLAQIESEIGPLDPESFGERYAISAPLTDGVSFDPTTFEFFDGFQQAPNPSKPVADWNIDVPRLDGRLTPEERAIFERHGFVVSGAKGGHSFVDVLYRIFTEDLPVFVTADSILNAWRWN